MNTISMASVDRLYQFCDARAIRYHSVNNQMFLGFISLARRLQKVIGQAGEDEFWLPLIRAVRQYRFSAAVAPLRFDDPTIAPNLSEERLRAIAEAARHAFPSIAPLAVALVDALFDVVRSPEAPLLDQLGQILSKTPDQAVVLIRASRLRPAVEAALSSRGFGHVSVATGDDLRTTDGFARVIVVGPARWYADAVFSAPRAPEIDVVHFGCFRGRWRPRPVFVQPLGGGRATGWEIERDEDADSDEPWPEIDWRSILQQATGHPQEEPGATSPDLVEARLFSLHGVEVVFLESDDSATSLVIDPEESEDRLVRRVLTRRITPGMFVLLRTEGGGDFIAPLADKALGERAAFLREKQRNWKRLLRLEIERHGLSAVAARLHAMGAVRSDDPNVHYWAAERCIHPRHLADFEALLRLIGLGDQVSSYWSWMHEIYRAHVRAGQIIRRRLLEKVRHADLPKLQEAGRHEFALSETEGGRLVAIRVEAVAPETVWITASRLARPFEAEV